MDHCTLSIKRWIAPCHSVWWWV